VEETIRRQFEPLLDPAFEELVRRHYRDGIVFEVDGRELAGAGVPLAERAPIAIRLGRRRTPSAVGYMQRNVALPADREGIAISTFGKVIKRGWDWLGLAPAARVPISGLIEAPDLAACLTLSKNDFIRTGARGASYLAYRKAIQEVVSRQLAEWGDARDAEPRPRSARLERDLERVLEDLADDFPLLRSLVERRAGGQKRLPMPGRGDERVPAPLFTNLSGSDDGENEAGVSDVGGGAGPTPRGSSPPAPETPRAPGESPSGTGAPSPGAPGDRAHAAGSAGALDAVIGRRRPARYGLLVQFEPRPDDVELARLVDSTIWINDAHPAYRRAAASRSLGYHTALAVALALAPLAVEARDEHTFITQFLAHWGGAQEGHRVTRRRARKSA
jgi:hypothetical protein